jgi:hypothetical protein
VLPLAAAPVLAEVDIASFVAKPAKGPAGTEVYLDGTANENDDAWAYFEVIPDGDEWVKVLDDSDDWGFDEVMTDDDPPEVDYYEFVTDKFEVPQCPGGKHRIVVTNDDLDNSPDTDEVEDAAEDEYEFTVTPTIEVTKVDGDTISSSDDAEGPAGTEVEVKGYGFGEDEEDIVIFFDDDEVDPVDDITADELGTWTGTFIVPAASAGEHEITAEGDYTDKGDVDDPAVFSMTAGITVSPLKGIVGSAFTVSGSGFAADEDGIEILLDGKTIKSAFDAGSDGAFEVTVTVPDAAMGTHKIDAEGDKTTKSEIDDVSFEVEPSVVVAPTNGGVGTQIEVSGKGLPAGKPVTVTYDGVTKGTGTTSSTGTLSAIKFAAAHTQSTHTADHSIAVTFDSSTVTATFAMESTAPAKPSPRTPLSGARLGVLGKQSPTLTWTLVDDPSGVTYGLQISATPDFSQVLISKSGLQAQGSALIVSSAGPEMSYTLTDSEALPFGTYYWRVKAVDGALNDSGWSGSSSFKAGLLPTWALIVVIVLAVVLIGALVYVLIIRDRVGLYD